MAERRPERPLLGSALPALALLAAAAVATAVPARADLAGHGGPVRALAAAPGGGPVVSGGFDYTVMVWDAASEALAARLVGHDGPVTGVAVSRDGRRAFSVGDDGAFIAWDLAGPGVELARVQAGTKLTALALSRDEDLAAVAGWDGRVRLLATADGREVASLPLGAGERANAVAFTDAGDLLAAGHLGTVRVWRAGDGGLAREWQANGLGVTALAVAPGGTLVATGGPDRVVRLWDARTGEPRGDLAGDNGPVAALAFSPDGRLLASGAVDGQVIVWDVGSGRAELVLRGERRPVWAVAFRDGGAELAAAGTGGLVRRWAVPGGERLGAAVDGLGSGPLAVAAAPTGDDPHDRGAVLFRKCAACHTLTRDGGNRAGPTLYDLFGRRAGSVPGYPYSRALKESDIVWDEAAVGRLFEIGPDTMTPGSKMPMQQMPSGADRAALIDYLRRATAPRP